MITSLEQTIELTLNDKTVKLGSGAKKDWVLFAGPDIYESYELVKSTAEQLQTITQCLEIPWVLKCSFDKANRSSSKSFRGPGMRQALEGLKKIKDELDCSLITDVHDAQQVEEVAEVADIIQIPAFLSRQTDLIQAAAKTGKILNIKKGQFLAPWDMKEVANKCLEVQHSKLLFCDRGTSFGYNRLITDFTGLVEMRNLGFPVVMDATHAVQLPGGQGHSSGGRREMIAVLARAAMAVGIDGLFLETHPDPDNALCDGPNSIALKDMSHLLEDLLKIRNVLYAE